MSILSWNCRGLGNPQTVRVLHQLVKEKNPSFVFLMETFCSKSYMEKIRCRLGFESLFVVDPVGRSGGLALFWRNSTGLKIYNYSRYHIQAIVKNNEGRDFWKLMGFYGHPNRARRGESWLLLKLLKSGPCLPWCCFGDFNEILEQSEKDGMGPRRDSQMAGFRNTLEECGLSDLGFKGARFTWRNHHSDHSFVQERLDRALGDEEWCQLFPNVSVSVLEALCSDHNPILICLKKHQEHSKFFDRGFKLEAAWTRDADYQGLVQSVWEQNNLEGDSISGVQAKLASCQKELGRWSRSKFGKSYDLLRRKKDQLRAIQGRANGNSVQEIKALQMEINEILEREDLRCKQRTKQHWYRFGDRNTKFFHSWANQRRKINTIRSISDTEGRVWRRKEEVSRTFIEFYTQLFNSQTPSGIVDCLSVTDSRVSDDMNHKLLRPFTGDEVRCALFQMHPFKSPGPDGFSARFFQQSWGVVGSDVTRVVLNVLNGGLIEGGINSTYICPVPKINSPSKVSDFRPISLCDVIYKIISKVLANRLKQVLPFIISSEQSAFIPGRLITDNILIAFEAFHTMDTRLKGKEGFMALKLDMSKAYDRLEWDFVEGVFRKLGFGDRYEEASGQQINLEKTAVFFSGNTKVAVRDSIIQGTGYSCTSQYERYLGLPALIGRSRIATFNVIKDRIWKRMNGWKEKFLSHAGKEILIKSVIQAMPTYTMSVFRLPKTLCRDINSMLGRFWWGNKENGSKMAWMAWSGLGRKKLDGGLGYRDLVNFNTALLAKQGWRFIKHPETLVSTIFREKYFPSRDFLGSSLGSRPSYVWRSICGAKSVLSEGLMWRVGDGLSIKIFEDKWIPSTQTHKIQAHLQSLNPEARVCELIDSELNWWNIPLLEHIFPVEVVEQICNIPISPRYMRDRLVWAGTNNGHFSVRSAYNLETERLARNQGCTSSFSSSRDLWKLLWQLKIPRSVQLFLWRLCNDILPTKEKLWKRRIVENPLCPFCGIEVESSIHAVWLCDAAKIVWSECSPRIHKCVSDVSDFLTLFGILEGRLEREEIEFFAMVAQRIWFRRNRFVFDGILTHPSILLKSTKESIEEFRKALDSIDQKWMGVGIVSRDSNGQVIASKCSYHRYVSNSLVAEAFGAKLCVEFGILLGMKSVVLEGDAVGVVNALNRNVANEGIVSNLIAETCLQLENFDRWTIKHVRREGNKIAHSLAKLAISQLQNRVWLGFYPSVLSDLVISEMYS
ncbi:uncharacterized protein LOC133876926 [Alnus glutinosa]|uniref:uncharacterized protein LOC133876926 n=1 Tax=Alnus glutinosa TaxID=3517 RepID=UPI002D797ECD|nr:uncharacterized protein LOC133876926 [Alnus glutinosa]